MQPPAKIQYDASGKKIFVPRHCDLDYDEFAAAVHDLDATCCSYPSGQRLDPKTHRPCLRPRVSDAGCEYHTARAAAREDRTLRAMPRAVRKKAAYYSADPKLLEMRNDVAVIAARREEILERLGTGESTGAWESLSLKWEQLEKTMAASSEARQNGDDSEAERLAAKSQTLLQDVRKIIKTGNRDEENWAQALSLTERGASLKTAETRRRRESGQVVGIDELMTVIPQISDAFTEIVDDPEKAQEFARRLSTLFGITVVRSSNQELSVEKDPALTVEHYLGKSSDESGQADADSG